MTNIETPPEGFQEDNISPPEMDHDEPEWRPRRRHRNDQLSVVPLVVPDKEDSWIKQKWRPLIAWQYVAVCIFDFIVAPVITMVFFQNNVEHYTAWVPLTLGGGGLYHVSMGAIIGVTSWSRGQEKIRGIER
jgi:hypothetical protein